MKKLLKILFILAIFIAVFFYSEKISKDEILSTIENIKAEFLGKVIPCRKPIAYNIGTFDESFGISREYFLSALLDAEKVWEEPSGKNLFEYDLAQATLPINLVYDYRQQTTSELGKISGNVKNTQNEYDILRAKYLYMKISFEKADAAFSAQVKSFNKRQEQYNEDVLFWNNKGGAPEEEFNKLESTKDSLAREVEILKIEEGKLKVKANEANMLVIELNHLAKSLNLSVEKYNKVGEALGDSFEEGLYTDDGIKSKIDIFEFSTRKKLVRILAHELGHALGIGHVEDSQALMYKFNSNDNLTLSPADTDAFNAICQ